MGVPSYGAAVGSLIYQKRKALGLTQAQLAEDAFNSSGKTRRVSELENGLVANPHPKTIDPLIVALKITELELEECAKQSRAQPDSNLDNAYREADNLVAALAYQFEHSNPDASFAELDMFLKEKAKEWAELKERIGKIEILDTNVSEVQTKANVALANGDFALADRCLQQAEDFQRKNSALAEVRKLSKFRVARADIQILSGKNLEALELYAQAFEFIEPFDSKEGYTLLNEQAYRLYESSRRSMRPYFEVPAGLLERALKSKYCIENEGAATAINYRLSLIYRSYAESIDEFAAIALLEKAISCARKAVLSMQSAKTDEEIYKLVSAEIALGNALFEKAKTDPDIGPVQRAIEVFEKARGTLDKIGTFPDLQCHVCNSLGSALMARSRILKEEGVEEIRSAIHSYRQAIELAGSCGDSEVWGAGNTNLGRALAIEARMERDVGNAHFLRVQAICAFQSALEIYPSVLFPSFFALGNIQLADTTFEVGRSASGHMAEVYLIRAVSSYEMYMEYYNEEISPEYWASAQLSIGRVFAYHAKMEGVDSSEHDNKRARFHFENARRVFEALEFDEKAKYCELLLEEI